MKYAKIILLAFLIGCSGSNLQSEGNAGNTLKIDDTNSQSTTDETAIENLVRVHFYQVDNASIQRPFDIRPMTNDLSIACRIDDPNNCNYPFRNKVQIQISGSGFVGPHDCSKPVALQSLSVTFDLEIEGSRRCLDQAISAIEKRIALSIVGTGSLAVAGSGQPVDPQPLSTETSAPSVGTLMVGPTWNNHAYAALDSLKSCLAADRITLKLPPTTEPTDPITNN